jgi:Protein of unknown function (DUF1572)
MLVKHFLDEYARYRALGENAMSQVSDDELNRVPVGDGNSIAMIARHVGGNLTSRFTDFLTSDGEKPWRDRDNEFDEARYTRPDVEKTWARGFDVVASELGTLRDDDLSKTVKIRGTAFTVHEALCRSIAHTAMHVGQIVLLAKIAAGPRWKTLSIAKGQSAAFNQNPGLQKASAQADALQKKR